MSAATGAALGSVASLWRYPVKSMMGGELNASLITERGLLGDRAHALVDRETGKVVSAKEPRKWAKLFEFRSAYLEPPGGNGPGGRYLGLAPDLTRSSLRYSLNGFGRFILPIEDVRRVRRTSRV